MGRPLKEGLSFFPCDVDILEDPKVEYITARFGAKGDGIFWRILCKIYRQGYALPFDEDAARLIARAVGDISLDGLVMDVVFESLKRGLFNEDIFKQFGLLTSRGIQKRYIKICKDSKRTGYEIRADLDLTTEKNSFPPEKTPKIPEFSTQSKEKKSKDISKDISAANAESVPYQDVIAYLNQKSGKSFRATSKDTKSHIKARFSEGYTLDDFKRVIDGRVEKWKDDPKMREFLRPSTLFSPKFENYLNDEISINPNSKNNLLKRAAMLRTENEAK